MKKLLVWTIVLSLASALCLGAFAEGLEIEEDWTDEQAIAAAEAIEEIEESDITSESIELAVPEEDVELSAEDSTDSVNEHAGFDNDTSVSAAGDVTIDEQSFPDANFRAYVKEEIDRNSDGVLSEDECRAVEEVRVYKDITSLKGIEWFSNLKKLTCNRKQLTSLDVSNNTVLTYLDCGDNQLTSLNVSNNTVLTYLDCGDNQLTSLNVSNNTVLTYLDCGGNQLSNLDVSKNNVLTSLYCGSNQLTSLDISNNAELTKLGCGNNQLTSLDVSKNTALTSLYCHSNQLTSLNLSKNVALEYLDCDSNQLTSLDVSNNTTLTDLNCIFNELTSLNVSKNIMLERLDCYSNHISTIDISNCLSLIAATKAGSRAAGAGSICFQIYDGERSYRLGIDPSTQIIANSNVNDKPTDVPSVNGVAINGDNFPDASFREYVGEEFDDDGDGVLSEEEIEAVDEIDVSDEDVTSLKGIEWFRNLEVLYCGGNQLTSLDVSKNTKLERLSCGSNQLTSLNVSGCAALEGLYCSNNRLTSLNVSKNTKLTFLECNSNQLMILDVSKNSALLSLTCNDNQLKSLDIIHNTKLSYLDCSFNKLTIINASGLSELDYLNCTHNSLTELNVCNCPSLRGIEAEGNMQLMINITNSSKLKDIVNARLLSVETSNAGYIASFRLGEGYEISIDKTARIVDNKKILYGPLSYAVVSVKDQTYTGKRLKPSVTVKIGNRTLEQGKHYSITYRNNKAIGTATVTIAADSQYSPFIGTEYSPYTGTATATFKINPKKVSGLKLQAGKKQLTASWKKVAGVTGYQIQFGLKSNFKGAKLLTVKKDKTVKKVLKSLKSGKVYYVRIRAYKKVGKATYYSAWSKAVKSKKIKK